MTESKYDEGYRDGLRAYAWYDNGILVVGTARRPLSVALAMRKKAWNYDKKLAALAGEEENEHV